MSDPKNSMQELVARLNKTFGDGTVFTLSGDTSVASVEVIPTGSLSLDRALGIGGMPRGRVVEIFGWESSGKTTLCQHIVASAQRIAETTGSGKLQAFIDVEHALNPEWMRTTGVDTSKVLITQPDSGEQALEIAEALVRSGAVDVIVVDSVTALVPRAEIEGKMGDAHIALQARLMSQALRKLTPLLQHFNVLIIFTNQLRTRIAQYGRNTDTTGGVALRFYASMRIEVSRAELAKSGDEVSATICKAQVIKNKLAPPFKTAWLPIYYDRGICPAATAYGSLKKNTKVVVKAGAWITVFPDDPELRIKAQGEAALLKEIYHNKPVLEKMVSLYKQLHSIDVEDEVLNLE